MNKSSDLPQGWILETVKTTPEGYVFTFIDSNEYETEVIYHDDELGEGYDWIGNNKDSYSVDLKESIEQFIIEYIVSSWSSDKLNEQQNTTVRVENILRDYVSNINIPDIMRRLKEFLK